MNEYRAQSWSWASIDGMIKYREHHIYEEDHLAHNLKVETVPKNEGELIAGTLMLSCQTIIRISVDEIDGKMPGSRGCYHTDPDGKKIGKSLYLPLKWDQSDPALGIYYLLPLSRTSQDLYFSLQEIKRRV